jgi:hypothetical protein
MSTPVVQVIQMRDGPVLSLYCPKCRELHYVPVKIVKGLTPAQMTESENLQRHEPWLWNGSTTRPLICPCLHAPSTTMPGKKCEMYVLFDKIVYLGRSAGRDKRGRDMPLIPVSHWPGFMRKGSTSTKPRPEPLPARERQQPNSADTKLADTKSELYAKYRLSQWMKRLRG